MLERVLFLSQKFVSCSFLLSESSDISTACSYIAFRVCDAAFEISTAGFSFSFESQPVWVTFPMLWRPTNFFSFLSMRFQSDLFIEKRTRTNYIKDITRMMLTQLI